jgi:hypothetical protein
MIDSLVTRHERAGVAAPATWCPAMDVSPRDKATLRLTLESVLPIRQGLHSSYDGGGLNAPQEKKHPRIERASRRPTLTATVLHPTLPGISERVERVLDTIENMFKSKHLEVRQREAALIFRSAWDVIYGSIGGGMDLDRVRGDSFPGSPPPPRHLYAAERLNQAKARLYARDYLIVTMVAGEGRTIEQTAAAMMGRTPSKAERTKIGDRLRAGLDELADLWLPMSASEARLRTWRPPDAVPQWSEVLEVQPAGVAHATRDRVYHSGRR